MSFVVVKLGGEALVDKGALSYFITSLLSSCSEHKIILVHGGGSYVDEALEHLGETTHKIDGERQTPTHHVPWVVGALAGYANQSFVSVLKAAGFNGVGLSLSDCGGVPLIQSITAGSVAAPDWENVDKAEALKSTLSYFCGKNVIPVVSPIGLLDSGVLVNVNADLAAAALAILLQAQLVLLSNVEGVLDADKNIITTIPASECLQLQQSNFVSDGMRIKLLAAQNATIRTRRSTAITSWSSAENVIAVLNGASIGTQVVV
ncbi:MULTISPECIES: acetylglutamate kinase [Gammaproteobacteria]|uniref:amino acid kinase family protein n=1 Tax=Gammaproteobacteria TaxID=1236 RepID=UPI000DD09CE5|nr:MULTISPECIES: acetylglutamate kinase [Gammaproteobacteria]RTE87346.1 acetylglutamate kinase [Aliidiomarina sp. B3213]TCZ92868.1 acetylglutamate kinase [Lysobacter sp. N42]